MRGPIRGYLPRAPKTYTATGFFRLGVSPPRIIRAATVTVTFTSSTVVLSTHANACHSRTYFGTPFRPQQILSWPLVGPHYTTRHTRLPHLQGAITSRILQLVSVPSAVLAHQSSCPLWLLLSIAHAILGLCGTEMRVCWYPVT